MKFEFLDRFSKSTRISNFIEIRPVGTEFFHSDGQADKVYILHFFLFKMQFVS